MQNFLVIQLARFGDLLQSKRLILSLQKQGNLTLCIEPSLTKIAKIVYPEADIVTLPAHAQSTFSYSKCQDTLAYLQKQNYDAVYNLNFSTLNSVLSSLFEQEKLQAYSRVHGQDLRPQWLDLAFRYMQNRQVAPLNLVDLWGLLAPMPLAPQDVNPPAFSKNNQSLGLVLAGRNSKRSLSIAELIPCAHSLFTKNQANKLYLLGTEAENKLAQEFLVQAPTALREKTINLCGKTNFQELCNILQSLDRLLTVDTGTMHLAAHLGVPSTALFCASAYGFETGAYGLGHEIWQSLCSCSPCLESKACIHAKSPDKSPDKSSIQNFSQNFSRPLCHQPFTEPAFFKSLLGKSSEPKQNILHLTSDFDDLGLTWHSQKPDAFTEERQNIRSILSEYLNINYLTTHHSQLIQALFLDKDWILTRQI